MVDTAEFYVDPVDGDDDAPGTTADPWRTTEKAGKEIPAINAYGSNVKLWLGQGTHGALIFRQAPLNIASTHYDNGLEVEGDGMADQVIIDVPSGGDWPIHNIGRTKFQNLTISGNPSSGGIKCAGPLTVLDSIRFVNIPLPLRVMEFSRLEASNLYLDGASDEFISLYKNSCAEISDVTFGTWSYAECFARMEDIYHASLVLESITWTGASAGVAGQGYNVGPFSVLNLNGLTIPENVTGVVHADGRVYA